MDWSAGVALPSTDAGVSDGAPADYPDVAAAVARPVARGEAEAGIVIDGAGLGSAIAANKVRGIRAAMCATPTLARYAREHNGANVLALGATLISPEEAIAIVQTFLSTSMKEARYIARLAEVRRSRSRGRACPRTSSWWIWNARRHRCRRSRPPRTGSPVYRRSAVAMPCLYECCPDRLRGVLDAGASRLGLHATGGKPGDVAASSITRCSSPTPREADIERSARRRASTASPRCA